MTKSKSWRDILPIHPAAELFPPMNEAELAALAEDIKKNALRSQIALWQSDPKSPAQLLDGRSRLDAIEIATGAPALVEAPSITAGKDFLACNKVIVLDKSVDPYPYVISANLARRHLSADDKRKVIGNLILAQPDKSDRQIAEMLRVSHHTVASVRAEMEGRGQIAHVSTRTDSKGRQQPAKRTRNQSGSRMTFRAMKLGDDVMAAIKGTSLDSAPEMDELIIANRGAKPDQLTDLVKCLVRAAAAGKHVSAIAVTKYGLPPPCEDIGANSHSEAERS
jgi:hypothetical protein